MPEEPKRRKSRLSDVKEALERVHGFDMIHSVNEHIHNQKDCLTEIYGVLKALTKEVEELKRAMQGENK
jgi:hypothetical protein